MQWLRLYNEVVSDRKLRRLPPAQRWVWIAVLVIARQSPEAGRLLLAEGVPVTNDDIADTAAVAMNDVECGIEAFLHSGMLHLDGDVLVVTNWDSRQRESDDVKQRVRAYRERHRNVTGNASETRQIQIQKQIQNKPDNTNVSARSAEPIEPTEPLRGGADAPKSSESSQNKPDPKRIKGEKELDYWLRIVKDAPANERVALLVRMAHEKIDLPLEPSTYARVGSLAKKRTASLLAKDIMSAAAQHIDGDPLDYLTALCNKTAFAYRIDDGGETRSTQNGGSNRTGTRQYGASGAPGAGAAKQSRDAVVFGANGKSRTDGAAHSAAG